MRKASLNPIDKGIEATVRSQYLLSIVFHVVPSTTCQRYLLQPILLLMARGAGSSLFAFLFGVLGFVSCFYPCLHTRKAGRESEAVQS